MSRSASPASSSTSTVFSIPAGLCAAFPLQFGITDLLIEADELIYQFPETPTLVDLLAVALSSGAFGVIRVTVLPRTGRVSEDCGP